MTQKIVYSVCMDDSARNGRGEHMLMIRASLNRREAMFPTNIYVGKNQFTDEIVVAHEQATGLNAMIGQMVMDLQALELEAFRREMDLTVQTLYSMYMERLTADTPLVKFCDYVMNYCTNRREVTKAKYRESVRAIDDYQPGVCLEDIDLVWLKKYERYCYQQGNNDSTIWSKMKILRALFNEAIKRDLIKPGQTPFKLYEIPEIRSRTDVLGFAELELLETYRFRKQNHRRVRDFFCLAAYTGLRWSDLRQLKQDNVRQIGDVTWLHVKTQKTGAFVQIPISIIFFGNAMRIMAKYRRIEDLCGFVDNSSTNRLLREVIGEAGVGGGQRITMHTARRSCLTALADYGVPIQTIQKLAGHSRISTTQKYIQLSTGTIVRDLQRAFPSRRIDEEEQLPVVYRNPVTGKEYREGNGYTQCRNCSFYRCYRCTLFRRKTHINDWCRSFSERIG